MKQKTDIHAALGLPPLPSYSAETITALLWAREAVQKHLADTYKVIDPKGIEELKPVKIGGIDQWLHIRGNNRNNPVLLYLHGGPGCPIIGFEDAALIPWEEYFTVVRWDQRQTGKSYYPANDETDPLSIERFISDTEEVAQYLLDYFNKEKLVIVSSSWGTVLGMHMVKRHPDWIHAYVGMGQVVNSMEARSVTYERLLMRAKEQNEQEIIDKLEAIAPYPGPDINSAAKAYAENDEWIARALSRLAGENTKHHISIDDVGEMYNFARLISPHLTLTDIYHVLFGDEIASRRPPYTLMKELIAIDLPNDLGCSFDVPIFFFTGIHDYQTPVTQSDRWFSQIEAPHKKLVHFEESAHIIFNEEPGRLLVAMVNEVLPFAQEEKG